MKKIFYLTGILCIIFSLFTYHVTYASIYKFIRIGKYQTKVMDSANQGESAGTRTHGVYYYDTHRRGLIQWQAWGLGTIDWTDENSNYFPVKISNSGAFASNELTVTMPIPDEEGITIRKYKRYQPPQIVVDGFRVDEPFPLTAGDEMDPDKIPGTADVMVESWVNTCMGVTIHQRVLVWSQTNHDDYAIHDWTLTNTGNVDLDDEIELPDQTLNDFYFYRGFLAISWKHQFWPSSYGEYPTDSLRMVYSYPTRRKDRPFDEFGRTSSRTGYSSKPTYNGSATLHVDKSPDDPSNWPMQPQMTGITKSDLDWYTLDASMNGPEEYDQLYQIMKNGFLPYDGTPEMTGTYPGHHSVRGDGDERGLEYIKDLPWFENCSGHHFSCGPYTLGPGQSIRMVWANVAGSISPEKSWEIGEAWLAGTCTWDGPDDLADYYPAFGRYPDLAPTPNDQAKDRWIVTGKDSIFQNANAAQWNFDNDYNVPMPPPPPSIEVASKPDRIEITWGNESESASDFAGYRVYRAAGSTNYSAEGGVIVGKWVPIFECGQGTANTAVVHEYEDDTPERGQAYFYYVAAFDDGTGNIIDVHGRKESLESGMYFNRTTRGAYLTRLPATSLSDIRVVPNPFNVGTPEMQYIGEPNKIMFLDLPGYCTIKIYTESGDLVKTLYHTDGSGDESWGALNEEHSATEDGQLIVSGIYIALIEENDESGNPTGNSTALKFVVVR